METVQWFLWMCLLLVQTALHRSEAVVDLQGQQAFVNDIEFVFQLPRDALNGLIVLFHGCSHGSNDWWPESQQCKGCLGLPVETSIVRAGLARGFAMLAVSSADRHRKCWMAEDSDRIDKLVSAFYSQILKSNVDAIPLHLLGASSGGAFAAAYASTRKFVASINVQISSPPHRLDVLQQLPPTVFTVMTKDDHTLSMAQGAMESISKARILQVDESPLTANYLHKHSNGLISQSDSQRIYESLLQHKFLSEDTHVLADDPRATSWRKAVRQAVPHWVPERDTLQPDASVISELLNEAFALHEITDMFIEETLDWFQIHSKVH